MPEQKKIGMRSTRVKERFLGSYEDLQAAMRQIGAHGYWIERGPHKIFYAHDGAVMGWWRTTKTVIFQGDYRAARSLRILLMAYQCPRCPTFGDDDSPQCPKQLRYFRLVEHDD